jgi:cell division protein FtsB
LQRAAKPAGFVLVIAVVAAYGWVALRGPQGISSLIEKHRLIRELQEKNANAALENERRREHIRRLKESPSEQQMEIRKQLKLQRPGETTFILPDAPKDSPKTPEPDPQ